MYCAPENLKEKKPISLLIEMLSLYKIHRLTSLANHHTSDESINPGRVKIHPHKLIQ